MFTNIITNVTDVDTNKIRELLIQIGMSNKSADLLVPFMNSLVQVYRGLVRKGMSIVAARELYELAMIGFLCFHEDIQKELDVVMSDEVKLKAAVDIIIKSSMATIGEAIREDIMSKVNKEESSASLSTVPMNKKLH